MKDLFVYNENNEIIALIEGISVEEVNWSCISKFQKLSESFIEKHKKLVNWYRISEYQKLSESFIEKYKDLVDWYRISEYQKLSESFIEKYKDLVNWYRISAYQKLSESFIEKYKDLVNWSCISKFQKLSESFIKKYKDRLDLEVIEDSWNYKSAQFKLEFLKSINIYKIVDDSYIIAYKSVRDDYYSAYNFQYYYEVGKIYEAHCDCSKEENSFGLSAWTKEDAINYYKGRLLKVKINIEDIGRIVRNNHKIRCNRMEILEEIKE